MNTSKHEIGIIGLGKMGGNLASQALEKDIEVVGSCHCHDASWFWRASLRIR